MIPETEMRCLRMPILRALFMEWRAARGNLPRTERTRAFSRNWEDLLKRAELDSAELRREAESDARTLQEAGWLELRFAKFREYQIDRVILPLAAEDWLRSLFSDELPPERRLTPATMEIDWAPELAFLTHTRVAIRVEDLIKLNEFFRQETKSFIPVKERSLLIFGDEKRLDALRFTTLFAGDRLTLERLRCYSVPEPLGWKRGRKREGPLIVLENAATWESYCRWDEEQEIFSAIVYGCGNRFADSVSRLSEIFDELGGPKETFYFGDLDPQGIRIPLMAAARAVTLGMPSIKAHDWSYANLLRLGAGKGQECADLEPIPNADLEWFGALAEPVSRLICNRQRLAQEHVGWEFLRGNAVSKCGHP